MHLPLEIDALSLIAELNSWGWRDHKIETCCGFSSGYICAIRRGDAKMMAYQRAARLNNFYEDCKAERRARESTARV